MRSMLTLSLLCLTLLCGCGSLGFSGSADASLDKARDSYRKSIESVAEDSHKIDENTKAAADSLAAIAEKLDQVIENTSPRRARGVGSGQLAVEQDAAVGSGQSAVDDDDQASTDAPLFEVSAPASPPLPIANSPLPDPTAEALDRLSEKFDQLSATLQTPKSPLPPSGNDITLPGGELVNVKEFIADNFTNRHKYQGDPIHCLVELGFSQLELECLNETERAKVYDAWTSRYGDHRAVKSSPQPAASQPATQQVYAAPQTIQWQCNGRRCYRVR